MICEAEIKFVSRPATFAALSKLFDEPQYLGKSPQVEADVGITSIDHEEQTAGYQAAYSRLAASEVASPDPTAGINDPRLYLSNELMGLVQKDSRVGGLLNQSAPGVTRPFLQSLVKSGFDISILT